MNDLTRTQLHPPSSAFSATDLKTVELAKALALVAPITMTTEQQELWLRAAADALQDIRGDEIAAVITEVRRTVTRPSQIVPEIARLVADRRKRAGEIARLRAENDESYCLPRAQKHIADRDRRTFGPSDWAELNDYLETQGSIVRYRDDGTRYELAA